MSNTTEVIKLKELDPDMIAPSTATFRNIDQGGSKIVVIGKPGTGKCLAPGTLVMMSDGSLKKVEHIRVGDLLMGDDSTPRTVLSICHGYDSMYKIRQLNGEDYTVNAPHILSLINTNHEKVDIPVSELLELEISSYKGYKVPVNFPSRPIDIDPYLIGFWSVYPNMGLEISDFFYQKLSELCILLNKNFSEQLTMIGNFLKDVRTKYIPDRYLRNTREIRLQVLAGALDAVAQYDFGSDSYTLESSGAITSDIAYLARSLGFETNKKITMKYLDAINSCSVKGRLDDIPVRIIKKFFSPTNTEVDLATSINIQHIGHGEYYGFQLDGNHRFLLGDFTVTHNTTLIASLLYSKKHIIPVAMAMSGTEDSNHFHREIMPSTFVFNTYDEVQLEKFIQRQKIAREHLDNPWAVVILDDCTDDPSLFRKPLQNGMYKRGRHWKMWYILSLQYGMDVRPVIRTNIDGVFILREPNMRNRKVMYENYASIIPDFKLFCDILDQMTSDYTALYIHNASKTNDWKECVFWYKAKPIPQGFRFGCDDYWIYHDQRYNPEYVDQVNI